MDFMLNQKTLKITDSHSVEWVEYDPLTYHSDFFSYFSIEQPLLLESWINNRQAQFLAGRIAAKNSLPASYKNQTIAIGQHREPVWPKGIIGSISHDKNNSIAVTQEQQSGGVGIDVQTIFNSVEAQRNNKVILSRSDQDIFKAGFELSVQQLSTLIFSAKECFFKAVFNQVGEYFDFNSVSIKSLNEQTRTLTIGSDSKLSERITAMRVFTVHYKWIKENRVICILDYID